MLNINGVNFIIKDNRPFNERLNKPIKIIVDNITLTIDNNTKSDNATAKLKNRLKTHLIIKKRTLTTKNLNS